MAEVRQGHDTDARRRRAHRRRAGLGTRGPWRSGRPRARARRGRRRAPGHLDRAPWRRGSRSRCGSRSRRRHPGVRTRRDGRRGAPGPPSRRRTPGCRGWSPRASPTSAGLLMRDGDDAFLAAGAPVVPHPVRPRLAVGRPAADAVRHRPGAVHAARAGPAAGQRRATRTSEEQPGKILHEVRNDHPRARRDEPAAGLLRHRRRDPAVRLHAGRRLAVGRRPRARSRALLPAVRRCLEWVLAQSAESGWLRYVDVSGRGLANQGWKDSVDSVQFADGRLADPPIALSEVQGYAYEAAVRGAALLAAFGEQPVEGLAAWAASLRERFGRDVLGGHPRGRSRRDRARRRTARPGRLGDLQHGPPARHRDPRRRTQADRVVEVLSGPEHGLRLRAADADRRLAAVLPAQLPRRLGVAARHRGRGARPGPGGPLEEAARLDRGARGGLGGRRPTGCPSCTAGTRPPTCRSPWTTRRRAGRRPGRPPRRWRAWWR